jgi:uncharacterized membrane protein
VLKTVLTVHIVTGALGLLSGFVALYAAKGAALHRASGKLFVYSMVTMSLLGVAISGGWGVAPSTNIPVGLLTAYLVITALTAVVPPREHSRRLDIALLLVALAVSLSMFSVGVGAIVKGGKGSWMAVPGFIFATIAFLGSVGDVRVLRSGAPTGGRRLARHLWRMSTALAIAALSFSTRLPRILPPALRSPIAYTLPTLLVLATMFYWLWRVRSKRSGRVSVATLIAPQGGHAGFDGRVFEFACHENNYSMPVILTGARTADRETTTAKQ